jgi:transposase
MAPNFSDAQHEQIEDLILTRSLTNAEMANVARCNPRSIRRIHANLRCFGTTKAPPNGAGRPRTITPPMLSALCDRLLEKPGMYLDEMVLFFLDDFDVLVATSTISRVLTSAGWSKKVASRIAKERNADLRDFYLHKLSDFRSYQLVYIDESGCDKRIGFRRTGWSPLGVAPVQVARLHREQRYQILPAYAQDGIVLARVFQGSTDAAVFENSTKQLLRHCGRWPAPRSVVVMDNASFHHSDTIERLFVDAGVVLLYLPPYSPDLNPIEEFFCRAEDIQKTKLADIRRPPAAEFWRILGVLCGYCGRKEGKRRKDISGTPDSLLKNYDANKLNLPELHDPSFNVADKTTRNCPLHAFGDIEFYVLVLMDLLEIDAISQSHVTSLLELRLVCLAAHMRTMPSSVSLYGVISQSRDVKANQWP